MPFNVVGNINSNDNGHKIDELNERGYILLSSTSTSPRTTLERPNINYVDNKFKDAIVLKNTENIDLNDRNVTNARFI